MITGQITTLVVPQVQAGQEIKATIGYQATNPGALYWKTFLIAHSGNWAIMRMLEATREIGSEGGGEKTYDVGIMPNEMTGIVFRLFGHADANYNWNWEDLYQLLESGYSSGAQPLAFSVVWLEPQSTLEPVFSGLSVNFIAGNYSYGDTLALSCSFYYVGPAYSGAFIRGSIGNRGAFGFGEIVGLQRDIAMPSTPSNTRFTQVLSLPITSQLAPGMDYDLEVKLGGIPGNDLFWSEDNIINIEMEQIPPGEAQFRNFQVVYKKA